MTRARHAGAPQGKVQDTRSHDSGKYLHGVVGDLSNDHI